MAAPPITPLLTFLRIPQRRLCLTMLLPCSGTAEMLQWIPIAWIIGTVSITSALVWCGNTIKIFFFPFCVHVCIYFNWYLSLISLLLYHNSLTSMKSTARNFFVVVQFILHLESLHHVLNSFECFSSFSACFRLRINSCTFHFNMTNILSVQIMVLFCKGLYVNRYNIFDIFYCRNGFSNLNSKYMFLKCSRSGGTVYE